MLKLIFVLMVSLAGLCSAIDSKDYSGYKVYRIVPQNNLHLSILSILNNNPNIDIWTSSKLIGLPTVFMVPPVLQNELKGLLRMHNLHYQTLVHDVKSMIAKEKYAQGISQRVHSADQGISFKQYERFDTITAYLKNLAKSYPKLTKLINIGKTYEGRELNVLKVSSGGSNKPAIFVDGGIHAREWIAPATVLYIINQLVENNTIHSALTDNVDWYILPVINPDGYEYSHEKNRLWRKTRSNNTGISECIGTDGNRNFDFHWNEAGASTDPCSVIYSGAKPFSEIETASLANFALSIKTQVKLYLTFHSSGEYILYPWGWTSDLPDDVDELDELGRKAKAVSEYNYTVGSSTNMLYKASGGSDDWFKAVAGVNLSYTIELPAGGNSGFDLPPSQIDRVVKDTFKMVRVFHEHVDNKFT